MNKITAWLLFIPILIVLILLTLYYILDWISENRILAIILGIIILLLVIGIAIVLIKWNKIGNRL